MIHFDPSTMVLPGIIGAIIVCLLGATASLTFHRREARLNPATRYSDIKERLAVAAVTLAEKQELIRQADQQLKEKDLLTAEIAGLQTHLDHLRAEHASLADAKEDINKVKNEAAEAATELNSVEQALEAKKEELEKGEAIIEKAENLGQEIASLETQLGSLTAELAKVTAEYQNAIRAIQEASSLEAKLASLNQAIEEAQRSLDDMAEAVAEKEDLERGIKAMQAILRDEQELMSEKAALEQAVAELSREEERLADVVDSKRNIEAELASAEARLQESRNQEALVQNQIKELEKGIDDLELRKLVLEEEIVKKRAEAAGSAAGITTKDLLDDLLKKPACLASPGTLRGATRTEIDALPDVDKYLKDNGLTYSHRTVRAFHTALKINDNAQLTVLAGVSGTGKSLLPRCYAEALGIHFHQIAVEPRWDSPQDLLGFYNYIEKKYRATDLARLLLMMNPYEKRADVDKSFHNHMALVLLDEMNLARVEYYFSEFLSRLEVRPAYGPDLEDKIKNSLIPIDIRGLKAEESISLFPSHNVLFVGTMNDDESTQALSDKVLDRSNVMQFAAPRDFAKVAAKKQATPRDDKAQSFSEWRSWIRSPAQLSSAEQGDAVKVIKKLADIMQGCGRPFGHRLHDSILAYVANYPRSATGKVNLDEALADQIEFRIMPKLRGVEIGPAQPHFEALAQLLRDELHDISFSETLQTQIGDQQGGSGLFVWRGLTRQGGV